jgi:hypothetical protein
VEAALRAAGDAQAGDKAGRGGLGERGSEGCACAKSKGGASVRQRRAHLVCKRREVEVFHAATVQMWVCMS